MFNSENEAISLVLCVHVKPMPVFLFLDTTEVTQLKGRRRAKEG